MSVWLLILGYVAGALVTLAVCVWRMTMRGERDDEAVFFVPPFWPVTVPVVATYIVVKHYARKALARRRELERQQYETERLLEREGLL